MERDVKKARELLNSMKQDDVKGCALIVDELEKLYGKNIGDKEIALAYAMGLVKLSAVQSIVSEVEKTISKLESLYEAHKADKEIVLAYAQGLVNLSAKQSTVSERAETVSKLESLYEAHKADKEMVLRYAQGLVNLSVKQSIASEVEKTVSKLENLYEAYKADKEIVLIYGKGLVSLSVKQSIVSERAETVSKLESLYEAHKADKEMVLRYAQGLVNLSVKQSIASEVEKTVSKLESLYEAHKAGKEIVLEYAKGLLNLSNKQRIASEVEKTVSKLENLYEAYKADKEIVLIYGKGLLNLSFKQSIASEVEKTVSKLESLYEAHKAGKEIVLEYAKGLLNLSVKQSIASERAETVSKLESLYEAHKADKEIVLEYAKGLISLSVKQRIASEVEKTVSKLENLYEAHKVDKEMVLRYAQGLVNLSAKQSIASERAETVSKLESLYEAHKADKEIVLVYTKGLTILTIVQNVPEKCREVILEVKKLYETYKDCDFASLYFLVAIYCVCGAEEIDNLTLKNIQNIHAKVKHDTGVTGTELLKYFSTDNMAFIIERILTSDEKRISKEQKYSLLDTMIEIFSPKLRAESNDAFYQILQHYMNKDGEKEEKSYLIKLYLGIAEIKNILLISEKLSENEKIGHYTKIPRLKNFLGKQEKKGKEPNDKEKFAQETGVSKLWLFNASYMNDPSEGKALLDYLSAVHAQEGKGETANRKKENNSLSTLEILSDRYREEFRASNVYLFSLTKAIDILPMWSLYGDDGKGCCLTFDGDFFDVPQKDLFASTIRVRSRKSSENAKEGDVKNKSGVENMGEGEDEKDQEELVLHRVCYLPSEKDFSIEKCNTSEETKKLKKLLNALPAVINKISLEGRNKEEKEKVLDLMMDSLDEIRYLFKTSDYSFEQEYRLLKSVPVEDKRIQLKDTESVPRLYIESGKESKFEEIILGPKVEDPDFIAPYISYAAPKVKISKSKIKYR